MRGVYLRGLVAAGVVAAGVVALPAVAGAATGSTLYVDNTNKSCIDSGGGTSTTPFCTIAAAAAVAQPGQTVQVAWGVYAPTTITASGTASEPITFDGDIESTGDAAIVGNASAAHGFVIDGASNVVIRGFNPVGAASLVLVENAANVTVDQINSSAPSASVGIEVSGTSSDVTLSRNLFGSSESTATGIQIDSGVKDTTITTNEVENDGVTGISVDGATGTVVNSNTVSTECGAGIVLSGASTNSTVENNIVDTAQGTTPEGSCSATPNSIEVDASAVSGTVADYNLIDPASGGALYEWNGTAYSTLSSFTAATAQGAHDIAANPDLVGSDYGLDIAGDSPAIDSADANAPGELSTDAIGNARVDDPEATNTGTGVGYYDRGAFEFEAPLTGLTVSSAHESGGGPLDATYTVSIDNPWADSATYTIYFGDGTSQVVTTTGQSFSVNHTFAAYSDIIDYATVYVTDASKRPEILAQAVANLGAGYVPVTPLRILDTRNAIGIDTKTPITAGSDVVVQVAGEGGVPANASAIVANVTAVSPTGSGYLTVYADGQSLPKTSSLNYSTGQTVPNLVTTRITDGKIRVHVAGTGTVHVLVDLEGYYGDAGDGYAATGPKRVLDTREAIGVPTKTPLAAGGTITLSLTSSLPAGVTTVAMNITETGATGNGVLTVYPAGTSLPNASNLNFSTGQTLANEVIVPVVNGKVQIHDAGHGAVHVIADLAGYYGSSATDYFIPYQPLRLADTRNGTGNTDPASAQRTEELQESAVTTYVSEAAVYNLTETQPTSSGFLTLFPGGTSVPTASDINFTTGMTRANMVMVPLNISSSADTLNVYDGQETGTVQFILDLQGLFQPEYYGSGSAV